MEEIKKMSIVDSARVILSQLSIFSSLEDYTSNLDDSEDEGYGLIFGQFAESGYSLNTQVVHPYLRRFKIQRDGKGCVLSISDSKTKIVGAKLAKIMVATYAISQGVKKIIIEEVDDDVLVFLLPSLVEVLDGPISKKKDHHEVYKEVHTFRTKANVFYSIKTMKAIASLQYIDITKIKDVTRRYNNIVEKEAYSFDPKDFDSLEKLEALIENVERRAYIDFYGELIGAKVDSADIEDKIKAFALKPSKQFARTLKLLKPYMQPLFERGSLEKVERVELSDLDAADMVLMTNMPVDDKFYDSLRTDPESFLVHKASANIGIKKNGKFENLTNVARYSAKDLLEMLTIISSHNSGSSKTRMEGVDDEDHGLDGLAEADI